MTALLLGSGLLFASPGCGDEGIGDPCTPEQEYDVGFLGFDEAEVNVESKSFQCRTRICLVNHFRGRVSCAYGQDTTGSPPAGAGACVIPGTQTSVTGAGGPPCNGDADCGPTGKCHLPSKTCFLDTRKQSLVAPQCLDRIADKTVYCSCRCADKDGNKPSDQVFCDCPDGFSCSPLVGTIGLGNEGLTGSYCIKKSTEFDKNTACNAGDCDPANPKGKCN